MSSKAFVGIWYPDEDPSHLFALHLLETTNTPYVCICHKFDTNDDGSLKKKHYHVFFKFRQERYLDNVAKLLDIKPNYIQECLDEKGSLRYFLHADHPHKYQYRLDDCHGPLIDSVERAVSNCRENTRVVMLLNVLDKLPIPCTYTQFMLSACDAGLYSEFRRLGVGARLLLEDHNSKIL